MEFEIARMALEHQAGRGFVHYTAWRETYRGLLPDAYLEAQTLEKRVEQAALFPHNTFVALSGGQVIGFACYCERAREFVGRPEASEIAALYVLRAFQGQGAGRALLRACLDVLPGARTALFVLKGNDGASRFYQHMGFAFTGRELREETGFGAITEREMLR